MILIGGENLIDFIQEPGGDGHPLYRAIPGGSPYNTAKAAARQEVATGYLSPFSTDTLGALLEGELRAEGVAVLAPSSDRPTSLAVVSLSDGHARYQFYREGTAERDISAGSLAGAVPEGAVAFQIGSLALAHGEDADIWASFFLEAAGQGLFTSLDPNIRPAFIRDREAYLARLERLYSAASLIKLSDEDL
ncbi:MAG: PfkB family carbohydrate kinase, partial [Pseudomonadota bacterium]